MIDTVVYSCVCLSFCLFVCYVVYCAAQLWCRDCTELPIHFFRHFLCRRYHSATTHITQRKKRTVEISTSGIQLLAESKRKWHSVLTQCAIANCASAKYFWRPAM